MENDQLPDILVRARKEGHEFWLIYADVETRCGTVLLVLEAMQRAGVANVAFMVGQTEKPFPF